MALAVLEYTHHGDTDTARALLRDARARAVAIASRSEELRAVFALGDIEFAVGRLPAACATFDEGIKLAEQSGLARSPYGVETRILGCIAHYTAGDWDAAERLAAAIDDRSPIAGGLSAVALYVDVGRARLIPLERLEWLAALGNDDPWIAYHTGGCTADLACWQGDLDRARALVRSTLARVDELGEARMLSAIWPTAVGATRVVVIDGQDAYSQGLSDTVERLLRNAGLSVRRESVNPDTTSDFSSLVARIPSDTQVVYIPWQLAPKAQLFGQQLRAAGKNARLFGSDGLFDPDNFKIPGSLISFTVIAVTSAAEERAMQDRLISGDNHIDLTYCPPDLWSSQAPAKWKLMVPRVEELEATQAALEERSARLMEQQFKTEDEFTQKLASQQLTELTTTLAGARGQKAELDAKARMIRGMLNSGKPIEAADVTGVKPAVPERSARFIRRIEVPTCHVFATNEDLPVLRDSNLDAGEWFPYRSARGPKRVVERDDRRGFRQSITLDDQEAEAPEESLDLRIERCRANYDRPELVTEQLVHAPVTPPPHRPVHAGRWR